MINGDRFLAAEPKYLGQSGRAQAYLFFI